jgi:hypothetical protein
MEFQRHAAAYFDYSRRDRRNPFQPQRYNFASVQRIVDTLAEDYGKWQDEECKVMKHHLMSLDPLETGRVPMNTFHHAQIPYGHSFSFTESAAQLRALGALEESHREPQVLISNYLISEANCLPASSYFSICCINECELLMSRLEEQIRAPSAPPALLLDIVSNISSSTVDAPRRIQPALVRKLHAAADRHGAEVPLHGRLFRQWLHNVFPHECPYPASVTGTKTNVPVAAPSESASLTETDSYWSDEEVLPLDEQWVQVAARGSGWVALRTIGRLAALVAFIKAAASMGGRWSNVRALLSGRPEKAQYDLHSHYA